MKIYLLILSLFFSLFFSQDEGYIWPTDASKTVTAFFGEMRPNRYHTGIDIRTFGVNGKEKIVRNMINWQRIENISII